MKLIVKYHDITEILLKVTLSTIILILSWFYNNIQRESSKFKGSPLSDIGDLSRFLAFLFRPFGFIAPKTLNYLSFQSFDIEHTWWRLVQWALNLISTFFYFNSVENILSVFQLDFEIFRKIAVLSKFVQNIFNN